MGAWVEVEKVRHNLAEEAELEKDCSWEEQEVLEEPPSLELCFHS